ncbi:hypothetical protein F5Y19DRAFT_397215 [Xylariaceae sp. FL1651]|nr:hypothetical protein F5Y19DRAFT_397215 [Xylariaceae sp. FL1651]
MTREEALLLLPDFIENPYHLLPIIHEPSARSMINKFYMQLEQGQEGDPASAALILSIASTSASFFSQNASTHDVFSSIEEAAQSSMAWRQTALAILNEPHFFGGSLEECQARAILAYVVYNTEGCSARFRFLHSCSVAAARDMSLHLIDSVVQADRSDDFLTKEIKRRLWWHLASTDWLLGQVGGPLDGTYVIQPRHFNVNRPRNLNDNDLTQYDETLTYPLNVPTQMSCFLQRIRLSEICRELMDAKALGSLDVEITDFNTVTLLDRLFEQTLTEMPPFLKKDARIPQNAPTHLAQQRDLILLCFHIRRARLHRPFLLHDTDEPRYEPSRHQCIASARTVLSLSTELLEGSSAVDQNQRFGNPLAYRAGLVISSIFLACTILALNAGLIWNSVAPSTGDARMSHSQPEIHAEIARACRALVKAGEKSAFAANLLHNLMGVLKQYRVKDIDDLVESRVPPTESNNNTKYVTRNSNGAWPTYSARDESNSVSDKIDLADNFSLWNDFFTTIPELEGYDQLFAGLDSLCGPA